MKEFKCRDLGYQCDFIARYEGEDQILERALEHGRTEHGLKEEEIDEDLQNRIRSKIHDQQAA